jgi:hypothetical protein
MKTWYAIPLGLAVALLLTTRPDGARRDAATTSGAVTAEPGADTRQAQGTPPQALYRWRGADGRVHVESAPPPPGVRVEVIRLTGDPGPGTAPPTANAGGSASQPLTVYTPGGYAELKERLGDTLERLGERARIIEDLEPGR